MRLLVRTAGRKSIDVQFPPAGSLSSRLTRTRVNYPLLPSLAARSVLLARVAAILDYAQTAAPNEQAIRG